VNAAFSSRLSLGIYSRVCVCERERERERDRGDCLVCICAGNLCRSSVNATVLAACHCLCIRMRERERERERERGAVSSVFAREIRANRW